MRFIQAVKRMNQWGGGVDQPSDAPMKASQAVLLLSLALSGCSQKHATPADLSTRILVPTGVFIKCRDGYVLFVEKRNGTALQNVMVYRTTSDGGRETIETIHADNGTVSPAPDLKSMKLTLQDARSVSGSHTTTNRELVLVMHE